MEFIEYSPEYFDIIFPVVKSSGFELVELNSKKLNDGLHIHIVLYSPEGITIDDCSKVHRSIQRRLEAFTGERDIYIEVSSPGISRNIKAANEFSVFTGKHVKILAENNTEWTRYLILEADSESVTLETETETENGLPEISNKIKLLYSLIRKAKLDN